MSRCGFDKFFGKKRQKLYCNKDATPSGPGALSMLDKGPGV